MTSEFGADFVGQRAVVTGGGSGIGLATALLLAERGARVACLDLDPAAVPDPILRVTADVADDAVADAVGTAARELGGIDIVVNNAGIGAQGTVADNDIDEW
ncbi:MAG TPA: SDR family NAD(P)-dependent oxidoreductase, partial [Pseudonocardiaceae bacterium]|nr:SDR family NAD(P)-dependent oxidoreductase [Pseudonocardiaceae bacterium]